MAHRVAWSAANGPIPDGLVVHHKCFNRLCVNHEHLEAMEMFQNTRRQSGNDWPLGTCKYGHPDSELVYIESEKKRRCWPCYTAQRKERSLRSNAKRRARGYAGERRSRDHSSVTGV